VARQKKKITALHIFYINTQKNTQFQFLKKRPFSIKNSLKTPIYYQKTHPFPIKKNHRKHHFWPKNTHFLSKNHPKTPFFNQKHLQNAYFRRDIAFKVQYPGILASITADLSSIEAIST
jgi:hypothetical protein